MHFKTEHNLNIYFSDASICIFKSKYFLLYVLCIMNCISFFVKGRTKEIRYRVPVENADNTFSVIYSTAQYIY